MVVGLDRIPADKLEDSRHDTSPGDALNLFKVQVSNNMKVIKSKSTASKLPILQSKLFVAEQEGIIADRIVQHWERGNGGN